MRMPSRAVSASLVVDAAKRRGRFEPIQRSISVQRQRCLLLVPQILYDAMIGLPSRSLPATSESEERALQTFNQICEDLFEVSFEIYTSDKRRRSPWRRDQCQYTDNETSKDGRLVKRLGGWLPGVGAPEKEIYRVCFLKKSSTARFGLGGRF